MAIKILEFLDGNRAIVSLDGLFRVQSKRRGVVLSELRVSYEAEREVAAFSKVGQCVAKPYDKLNAKERMRR